jgi:AAA domain
VGSNTEAKPSTHQADLAKLPRALALLIERPQWAVWRWTRQGNGWQKPPYMATQPQRHASISDSSTWTDYTTALAAVQAGAADGISYILTEDDPFAAIDIDNCRHLTTHSIDPWAQLFMQFAVTSYQEVTPSGEGVRVWGLANGPVLHKKFSLQINDKDIAVELFRRTRKVLTITGYRLDTVRELTNIDKCIDWGVIWGERRKAAATAAAPVNGHSFESSGSGYSVDEIEQIVREGVPDGKNRSDVFHTVVGHFLGCGWSPEQIFDLLQQYPNGIGDRYLSQGRLSREIVRSASKYGRADLALFDANGGWAGNGWDAKARPQPEPEEQPDEQNDPDPELEDDDLGDDDLDGDEEEPEHDPRLPRLHTHHEPDSRPLKSWLIKGLMPAVGHGLMSGQWGAGKTFALFDLAAALGTGQPFLGHVVKRQCGTLLIAAEGADEVRLRLDAVAREKCGGVRVPFCWYEQTPLLLQKGAVEALIAMARQAEASLHKDFGLPLGLIGIDTIAVCAGYSRAGDENDNAVGQAIMNVLKAVARAIGCFVLGVDHFGKDLQAGTRGAYSKESSGDLVLACLGNKELSGSVTNTRLAVRKHRGGRQGQEYPFQLHVVEAPEKDEDGDPITTMVVDWLPASAAAQQGPLPPDDPWIAGCRQEEQRAAMSRLKRVLLAALAEHGAERPIPSPTHVPNSPLTLGNELGTPVGDAPAVRMVNQEIVREAFYLCTPGDPRQTLHNRYSRARDRAEQRGLIQAGNVDGVTYLWLTRPDLEDIEAEQG